MVTPLPVVYCNCSSPRHHSVLSFSPKIALFLQSAPSSKPTGPSVLEKAGYVRLSFRKGGQQEVGNWVLGVWGGEGGGEGSAMVLYSLG